MWPWNASFFERKNVNGWGHILGANPVWSLLYCIKISFWYTHVNYSAPKWCWNSYPQKTIKKEVDLINITLRYKLVMHMPQASSILYEYDIMINDQVCWYQLYKWSQGVRLICLTCFNSYLDHSVIHEEHSTTLFASYPPATLSSSIAILPPFVLPLLTLAEPLGGITIYCLCLYTHTRTHTQTIPQKRESLFSHCSSEYILHSQCNAI